MFTSTKSVHIKITFIIWLELLSVKSCNWMGCSVVENPAIMDCYNSPYTFGWAVNIKSSNKWTFARKKEQDWENKNIWQKGQVSLFLKGCISSPLCDCRGSNETVEYFFLSCPWFAALREPLFTFKAQKLNKTHNFRKKSFLWTLYCSSTISSNHNVFLEFKNHSDMNNK